jgi:hypothetical protein
MEVSAQHPVQVKFRQNLSGTSAPLGASIQTEEAFATAREKKGEPQ